MRKKLKECKKTVDDFIFDLNNRPKVYTDYLDSGLIDYIKNGGKRLRPALAIWFFRMNGGNGMSIIPIASGIEIFHTWTLVHDDIIDRDIIRRGGETLHVKFANYAKKEFNSNKSESQLFGNNMAILTGDIQQAWSNFLITLSTSRYKADAKVILALIQRLNFHVSPLLISGEAIDTEFEYRDPKSSDEILQMLKLKTAILLEFACQSGVCLALNKSNFNDERVKLAGEFAMNLGIAFQLKDDVLGLFASEDDLGKPIGADIKEGKKTLIYSEAVKRAKGNERKLLLKSLGNKKLDADSLKEVTNIIDSTGALSTIIAETENLISQAKRILEKFPDNKYRTYLFELADYAIHRKY